MSNLYSEETKGLFAKLENSTGYGDIYDNHILNPYVNYHNHSGTQILANSIVAEAVQMRGVRCVYIRRTMTPDLLFGEDPRSKFTEHFQVSVYVESYEGWQGDGDWMTKFGYSINDEMNISINPMLFKHQGDGLDAKEGDLLYFPMANALFELTWVEHEDPWYQVGQLPIRKIRCVKFTYSGEKIELQETSNYIDSIEDIFSVDETPSDVERINALDGRWDTMIEQGAEVEYIQDEADKFVEEVTQIPPNTPLRQANINVDLDSLNF